MARPRSVSAEGDVARGRGREPGPAQPEVAENVRQGQGGGAAQGGPGQRAAPARGRRCPALPGAAGQADMGSRPGPVPGQGVRRGVEAEEEGNGWTAARARRRWQAPLESSGFVMSESDVYLLGRSQAEVERLRKQVQELADEAKW